MRKFPLIKSETQTQSELRKEEENMQFKKEACRNFQRGFCQYGERCKFLHVTQQQQKSNATGFGFGTQAASRQQQQQQQQKPNPFGFGVQSKPTNNFPTKNNQFKPFENKWSRFSPITSGGAPASRQPDNQPQSANHKCTDPDSCKRIIVEDFQNERPLWKLTCYSHWKNAPCDIAGDVSYEELRAAAYDDAKRGLNLQSIVERERNLLNSKLLEFENLLRNPYAGPFNAVASQNPLPIATQNTHSQSPQSSAPPQNSALPSVSSFSQLGSSLNMGFGTRPSAPSNNAFGKPNSFPNSSQISSLLGTNNSPSASPFDSQLQAQYNPSPFSFSNQTVLSGGPVSSSNASEQATTNIQLVKNLQSETVTGDSGVWLKEKWIPGEIPEEAPPDAFIL